MKEEIEQLKKMLAAENYKLTSQREQILKILLDKEGEHLSAEEVYNILQEKKLGIGLATVYRTLELFCELGIVQQLDFDEDRRRYELRQGDSIHHHHLVCFKCGRVIEFNDQILEDFEENLQDKYNFEVEEHQIKFYGYCEECKKE